VLEMTEKKYGCAVLIDSQKKNQRYNY